MNKQEDENYPLQLGGGPLSARVRRGKRERARLQAQPDAASTNMLNDYYRTVSRHRMLIGLCALVGAVIAVLVGVNAAPVYQTRTSLNIEKLNGDFMDRREINPTAGTTDQTSEENVQTQIKMLQSETLLDKTAERLEAEPHAQFVDRTDLLSRLKKTLHVGGGEQIRYADLIEQATHEVKVKPLGMTHLVEITCDSWSAAFAAKFCNTMVAEYQAADIASRSEETRKTSDWLNEQVSDLRAKVQESQKHLEDATGGNGLILSQDSTTVGEDRLRQLQAELVRAQADRMQKESETRTALSSPTDTVPSVQDNATYRNYQAKLADLNAQVAALVPPLTEANPKVIHLRAEIKAVEEGMADATSVSQARLVNEFSTAKQHEKLLALTYNAQEANVSSSLQKMSRIALLRKEVESEQTIYETLLQRSKEAGLASAMQTSVAHVVDAARVPKVPFSPQRGKATAAGIALGSVFGFGFAFYKDRHSRLFREPGDVQRLLHVRELGVIPSTGVSLTRRSGKANSTARVLDVFRDGAADSNSAVGRTGWDDRFSIIAEAYRNATFSLLTTDESTMTKAYVISSPSAGEGKTTVASNMAVAMSKARLRVVLIDGDLRRPNLHKEFAIQNDYGMRDILRNDSNLDITGIDQLCKLTRFKNLQVIPSGTGTEDVVGLLHSPRVGALLARLSRDFDVILIDTPPMLHMADARIFAGSTQGAILVVRSGSTGQQQAMAARNLFDDDGVRIVGSVLNDFNAEREGRGDYYRSYYRYQTDERGRKSA